MLVAVAAASPETTRRSAMKLWANTPNSIVSKKKPPASLALNFGDDLAIRSVITMVLICFSLGMSAYVSAPHVTVRSPPHSFCPLKLHAWRTKWRLSVQTVSKCLNVMIRVHHGEHNIVHEEFLGIPGDI